MYLINSLFAVVLLSVLYMLLLEEVRRSDVNTVDNYLFYICLYILSCYHYVLTVLSMHFIGVTVSGLPSGRCR